MNIFPQDAINILGDNLRRWLTSRLKGGVLTAAIVFLDQNGVGDMITTEEFKMIAVEELDGFKDLPPFARQVLKNLAGNQIVAHLLGWSLL